MTSKSQSIKEKFNKLDFTNAKNFCSKDTLERINRQFTNWEEILPKPYLTKDLNP
jgi:hypothetical protein